MKARLISITGSLAFILSAATPGLSSDRGLPDGVEAEQTASVKKADHMLITVKVPVVSSVGADIPLAVVNNEKITLEDLREAVAETHQAKEDGGDDVMQASKVDFSELLKRLTNVQLMVQEAGNIGLDEIPEVKEKIDNFSKVALRNLLREEMWKDLTTNEKEIERLYRGSVDEVNITLVPFKKERDARKAAGEIRAGKNFDAVVAKAVKDGLTAVSEIERGRFFKMEDLLPVIAEQIPKMKAGSISPVRKIEKDGKTVFGFFRLEEKRTTDSETAKAAAREKVLNDGKVAVIRKYLSALYKTGIKINETLIASLNYGPDGPGIEKLMEDRRAVIDIQDEDPVTVGQLSEALQDKLYHGMRNLNSKKQAQMKKAAIDVLAEKRLLHREALKRGIDKTETYRKMLSNYKRDILFNTFMERVVVPEVRMSEEELKAYYRDHAEEYRSSEMVKMRTLAFKKKSDAAAVVDKLRKGADFGWVRTNAEGQLERDAEQLLPFEEEQFAAAKALPEDIQKTIEGPRAGDFRLYEGADGNCYVFHIQEVMPATTRPFEEVRGTIREKVFGKKLSKSVEEWAAKLRESYEVKVYLSGLENRF